MEARTDMPDITFCDITGSTDETKINNQEKKK